MLEAETLRRCKNMLNVLYHHVNFGGADFACYWGGPEHTHTHTRLTALFPGLPSWASTRKVNQSGFYWSKRQWVAVASAGPYASLHLAPNRHHASTPPLGFYRPDALPAAQPTVSKHWRLQLKCIHAMEMPVLRVSTAVANSSSEFETNSQPKIVPSSIPQSTPSVPVL